MTIWVGRFVDSETEFEILVVASNKTNATRKISFYLKKIITDPVGAGVYNPERNRIKGEARLIYIEEVGDFDYIRPAP